MRDWTPQRVAAAAGATLTRRRRSSGPGPSESRSTRVKPGRGRCSSGSGARTETAASSPRQALEAGAWGVLVAAPHRRRARPGLILAVADPLKALQRLATAWRRELNAEVIGVTGSTGKTSTKDLLLALLRPHRVTIASRANFNTEIGLPLEILAAPPQTEVLVLEMAMRGSGQIAELDCDRRARRGRDREHRAGASRAAGHGREHRRR